MLCSHLFFATLTALLPYTLAIPAITQRGATDTFGDYTGSISSYADGSGTYVRTQDVHRYSSGVKCWTDLFHVSTSTKDTPYTREGSIDCATSSSCTAGIDSSVQTCTEWSISVKADLQIPLLAEMVGSVGITYSHGSSKCSSVTTSKRCNWDDKKCHAIWSRTRVNVNHGYIRRRCNYQDQKGDQTVWSKDFDVNEQASDVSLGCKASCTETNYPSA